MDYRLKVKNISPAWHTCNYKFMVRVDRHPFSMERTNYILETLKKWFGEAEYFWDDVYLCELKPNF